MIMSLCKLHNLESHSPTLLFAFHFYILPLIAKPKLRVTCRCTVCGDVRSLPASRQSVLYSDTIPVTQMRLVDPAPPIPAAATSTD